MSTETLSPPAKVSKPLMKFRLLAGNHVDFAKEGSQHTYYRAGDLIESAVDLEGLHNRPGSRKFERIHDNEQVRSPQPSDTNQGSMQPPPQQPQGKNPQQQSARR